MFLARSESAQSHYSKSPKESADLISYNQFGVITSDNDSYLQQEKSLFQLNGHMFI